MAKINELKKADVEVQADSDGQVRLILRGRLDWETAGPLWREICRNLEKMRPRNVRCDAREVDYCDGSGLGLLFHLRLQARQGRFDFQLSGLDEKFNQMLDHFDAGKFLEIRHEQHRGIHIAEEVGRASVHLWQDFYAVISFLGETFVKITHALICFWNTRWKETFIVAERSGVNAVGIISLVGILFGLILAYMGVITLKQFGAEIYVANMASMSIVRVLGPFITSVILSGRSGSAFAAEIGTMKINEEVDALVTMGIDPVRFLVVPRVLATTVMTPLLTVVANLTGLVGCAVVLMSMGIPLVTFMERVKTSVDLGDFYGGLFKAMVYGMIIGAVGCLRGMETKAGPSAVGDAATQAVVTSIVLIIAAEGVFSILFYHLGI